MVSVWEWQWQVHMAYQVFLYVCTRFSTLSVVVVTFFTTHTYQHQSKLNRLKSYLLYRRSCMNIALSDVGKHISDETKTSKIVISLFAKHFFFRSWRRCAAVYICRQLVLLCVERVLMLQYWRFSLLRLDVGPCIHFLSTDCIRRVWLCDWGFFAALLIMHTKKEKYKYWTRKKIQLPPQLG